MAVQFEFYKNPVQGEEEGDSRTEICITGTDTFGIIHFSMLVQRCPCQQVLTGKVNLQILQVQFIAKLLIKSIIYLKILQTDISYIL